MGKILNLNTEKSKEEIYFKYADTMMLLCIRYVGRKEDAEELMHNGFLKAFKNIGKFRKTHKNSFYAWLKKIMINECLMHIRKNSGFNVIPFEEADMKQVIKEITEDYDTEYLLDMLKNLPPGYRTVFNLYVIEGYKHKEIAEMLGISKNTSRTQLLKARNQLQKMITEQNERYGS